MNTQPILKSLKRSLLVDASIATEPPCCRAGNMTTLEPYLFVGEQPSDAYCVLSAESIRGEIVDYIPEYQAIEIWRGIRVLPPGLKLDRLV